LEIKFNFDFDLTYNKAIMCFHKNIVDLGNANVSKSAVFYSVMTSSLICFLHFSLTFPHYYKEMQSFHNLLLSCAACPLNTTSIPSEICLFQDGAAVLQAFGFSVVSVCVFITLNVGTSAGLK